MTASRKVAVVTGASGFVGGHTARRLAEAGLQVRALVRNPTGKTVVELRHPQVDVVRADVLAPDTLIRPLTGATLVVHTAMSAPGTRRKMAWKTAVEGTRYVYDAARCAGVKRFLFISSFAVYFGVAEGPYDESTPLAPCGDLYADAKIAAETLLLGAPPGGPTVTILRPPAVYGPGSWFWSTRFVKAARRGWLFLPGGGEFSLAYIYIDNLVSAILAASTADAPGGVYNIFDGHMRYRDFVEPYAQMAGTTPRNLPLWVLWAMAASVESAMRLSGWWGALSRHEIAFLLTGHRRTPLAAEKACRELHWSPSVTFESGMQATRAWLEQEGYLRQRSVVETG
jgi:nucleoside-diphosphate-sugar epimerase